MEISDDSGSESEDKDSTALVQQLLKATGLSNHKKKGKKDFLPHLYVIKHESKDVVKSQIPTWYEHLSGIFRMLEDPNLPQSWIPNIHQHLLNITEMAVNWVWETVLL